LRQGEAFIPLGTLKLLVGFFVKREMLVSAIQLIVGLGNPGAEYENTRHNAGAWFVDYFASQKNIPLIREKKFFGMTAQASLSEGLFWILIPSTYMNESGKSVAAIARFYKIAPEAILVAHDELDFPVGTMRFKESGGHGGHNGLRSIIECLGTDQFMRLRIGIDHPGHRDRVVPYVLSKPSLSDREKIEDAISKSVMPVTELILGNRQKAFRDLHGQ
jgi:PTH1 family peptidyl-tRNA hydrolase